MEKVKIYYDSEENSLIVWFGEPQKEYICEETGEEIIIMKDKEGHVLGFEKLNYSLKASKENNIIFETAIL